MSSRHRQSRPGASHRVVPPRPERVGANRRARHSAAAELREIRKGADPEDLAETLPAHISARVVPDDDAPAPVRSRKPRHWKQRFWKRRSAARRARAGAAVAVAAGD